MLRRRIVCSAALVLGALFSLQPLGGRADARHYRLEEGVRVGRAMRPVLARIAREFHRRTGRDIVVTSGTRSPREQAEAMYAKIRMGQRLTRLYLDYDAAAQIERAYRRHRRRGRRACIEAMAEVVEQQIDRGCYISRHLRASAADVRSRDMSRRERRIFEQVVRDVREVRMLAEGTPPHFHLQLR